VDGLAEVVVGLGDLAVAAVVAAGPAAVGEKENWVYS